MLRTDRSSVLWAPEADYGVTPGSGWERFGMHDSINLPDPTYSWYPYYTTLQTKRASILKGRQSFSGSVDDIRLQSGSFLNILIPVLPDRLASFAVYAATFDTDGTVAVTRQYLGGKIGRATISAKQGEELKLSIGDMQFKSMRHNRSNGPPTRYDTFTPTDPGLGNEERFIFSTANLTFLGITLGRVTDFSIEINNGVTPYYGISTGTSINEIQEPTRILSGQISYTLTLGVDIVDPNDLTLWDFLLNQGATSAGGITVGASFVASFTRTSDPTLTITCTDIAQHTAPGTVFENVDWPLNVSSSGYYHATFRGNVDTLRFA